MVSSDSTCHAMLLTVCRDVKVSLIQTAGLKVRVKVSEDGSCGLAGLGVLLEVRLDEDQLRTEPTGNESWHGSSDAKLAGVVIRGAYHANTAHCHRFALLQGRALNVQVPSLDQTAFLLWLSSYLLAVYRCTPGGGCVLEHEKSVELRGSYSECTGAPTTVVSLF